MKRNYLTLKDFLPLTKGYPYDLWIDSDAQVGDNGSNNINYLNYWVVSSPPGVISSDDEEDGKLMLRIMIKKDKPTND